MTAAVLTPWWSSGHLLACLYGGLRTAGGGLLAPLGLSLWWPASYAMQWDLVGPWPASRVVSIEAFEQRAGFDTTLVVWPLVLLGTALVVGLVLRSPREDRRVIPLAVVLQVHVYAFLSRGVHENHTLLGLFLLPLLLGELGAGLARARGSLGPGRRQPAAGGALRRAHPDLRLGPRLAGPGRRRRGLRGGSPRARRAPGGAAVVGGALGAHPRPGGEPGRSRAGLSPSAG